MPHHTLSVKDLVGQTFRQQLASCVNQKGSKKLTLVVGITGGMAGSYHYEVEHNFKIVETTWNIQYAVEKYNDIVI